MINLTEILLISSNIAIAGFAIHQRQQIKKQRQEIKRLHICPTYGCLSRQGINSYWNSLQRKDGLAIVFLDIDHMGELNSRLGYQEVDQRLSRAFSQVRSNELLGRWYSGDELVMLVPRIEAIAAATRIQNALKLEGISATFGIANAEGQFLSDIVKQASALVQESKRKGDRGIIATET